MGLNIAYCVFAWLSRRSWIGGIARYTDLDALEERVIFFATEMQELLVKSGMTEAPPNPTEVSSARNLVEKLIAMIPAGPSSSSRSQQQDSAAAGPSSLRT